MTRRQSRFLYALRVSATLCATLRPAAPAMASELQILTVDGATQLDAPAVHFSADGAFSGTTGCNSFQGNATFEDGDLVIDGPVAATRMACPGLALTAQDDVLIALFAGRLTVAFDPLRDFLVLSNGETTVELVRMTISGGGLPDLPPTHAGLEPPTGDPRYLNPFGLSDDLPIHTQPDPASDVLGGAFSGQVLRNFGCEADWCQVEALDGSVQGWSERQYLEPSDSVLRAGQGVFDAVGPVPCAMGAGAPMGTCAMGVAGDGGGSATVVVTKPDGIDRILFFADGAFISSDTSEAGGGFETSAARESDLTLIRVDDERYEIADAVIFGG